MRVSDIVGQFRNQEIVLREGEREYLESHSDLGGFLGKFDLDSLLPLRAPDLPLQKKMAWFMAKDAVLKVLCAKRIAEEEGALTLVAV